MAQSVNDFAQAFVWVRKDMKRMPPDALKQKYLPGLNRAINRVSKLWGRGIMPGSIHAILSAMQELRDDYIVKAR